VTCSTSRRLSVYRAQNSRVLYIIILYYVGRGKKRNGRENRKLRCCDIYTSAYIILLYYIHIIHYYYGYIMFIQSAVGNRQFRGNENAQVLYYFNTIYRCRFRKDGGIDRPISLMRGGGGFSAFGIILYYNIPIYLYSRTRYRGLYSGARTCFESTCAVKTVTHQLLHFFFFFFNMIAALHNHTQCTQLYSFINYCKFAETN